MYQSPLSAYAKERLAVLRNSHDGFEIARRDLELRGPGEVLGTRQTGLLRMKIADLIRNKDLLPNIQKAAEILISEHGQVINPLIQRWVAGGERYGHV